MNHHIIETLITLYTIEQGEIKVLLFRKKTEPYKGYWMLPGKELKIGQTVETCISEVIYDQVGLEEVDASQLHVFSNPGRYPSGHVVTVSFLGLSDSKTIELKREARDSLESAWFSFESIPKMAFDHLDIVQKSIETLKKKIINSNILRSLFPSDFTLPELQTIYESILGRELDRRNFRKKFVNLGLIEDTGDKSNGTFGRPAKLYRFKEEIRNRDLF